MLAPRIVASVAESDLRFEHRESTPSDPFAEWVKDQAIPVERWKMNNDLTAYLDLSLKDKRILFIGEPSHFFREKYDVQLMLIEHLARRGYRHLFIEGLGASESEVVNEYVRTGKLRPGTGADAARIDRFRANVVGRGDMSNESDFQHRVQMAQRRFFDALHQINLSLPKGDGSLTIHPIDISMPPGGCWFTIKALLDDYADNPELVSIRDRCERAAEEPISKWIKRLETVRTDIQTTEYDILDALPPEHRGRLQQCVDCLVESLAFMETRRADGAMDRALVRREPAMFRQVQFAMDRLPSDAKVIMMAHNNHLSRIGADTMRARQPSVGERIQVAYPGQIFSLWMLYDRGWLLNPMAPEPLEKLPSDPERVESLLARAGSTYLLPLHTGEPGEEYLDEKRRVSYFSWFETATLSKQTDAIFFLDEITPLENG